MSVEAPVNITEGEPQTRNAWLFPPQGHQEVGMGRQLYEQSPVARNVFDRIEEVVGWPLREYSFRGPPEKLLQTRITQVVIYANGLALTKHWQHQGKEGFTRLPLFAGGHSLGEFTLVTALGILSEEDGARLIDQRGAITQEVAEREETGLLAILSRLSDKNKFYLEGELAKGILEKALINTSTQIVYGGRKADLVRVQDTLGKRKATILNVAAAFHTSFMRPAQERFAEAVYGTPFQDSPVTIIANTTGEQIRARREVQEELIRQMASPANFLKTIQAFKQLGVEKTHEVGEKPVLSRMIQSELGGNVVKAAAVATLAGAVSAAAATAAVMWYRHQHPEA